MGFLDFLGKPLGMVMSWIYQLVPNYFITVLIFAFLVRLVLFPVFLKQQKVAMDRAKLAPALERLQKKYANDRQKLAEKQQQLYEKHGVSMTAGCLPMVLSMLVLFGVIAAIYAPLANLSNPPIAEQVISVAQYAVLGEGEGKLTEKDMQGYYGELRLMLNCDEGTNKEDIIAELNDPSLKALQRAYKGVTEENYDVYKANFKELMGDQTGEDVYNQITEMSEQFTIMNSDYSLLEQPWSEDGLKGINWLWLIPLISGLTSFFVSYISMQYNKRSMPKDQPGQGLLTNGCMMVYMPAISLFIAFKVPGAVGIYWIFSNLLSMVQTVVVNKIYDPAKAREQAEKEYQERKRRKAEDKKRLAQARQREEAEARKAEQELERQREESRQLNKKKKKGGSNGYHAAKNEAAGGETDAVDNTQPAEEAEQSTEE
ncbi:MAG: membrane protein insertase YidC [Clostridia bacterium]|nr:membrane protein insertase YidC [Clostridia bacterium]